MAGQRDATEAEDFARFEDEAVVTSLRNVFLPRLMDRDASLFATIVQDLWPHVDVPMGFAGTPMNSLQLVSQAKSKSHLESRPFRGQ